MMLLQNYNVAFKKQLGKVYNFKFGIRVTMKMQITATVPGCLGECGGTRISKAKFQPQGHLECLSLCWSHLPVPVRMSPWRRPAEGGLHDTK